MPIFCHGGLGNGKGIRGSARYTRNLIQFGHSLTSFSSCFDMPGHREHDKQLLAVLNRLEEAGLTLNREKCKFSWREVKFLGHILSQDGVHSDPDKVSAIVNMEEPMTVKELRRFLGIVNQLSKFMPHLAEMTKPLRDLLSKKNQ